MTTLRLLPSVIRFFFKFFPSTFRAFDYGYYVQLLQQRHTSINSHWYPSVEGCDCGHGRRLSQSLVCAFEGAILRSQSSFPYYMLVAFEAGSAPRALLLLILSPLIWLLQYSAIACCQGAGVRLLVFVAMAGLKAKEVRAVARAVLYRFYAEDLHPETYRVLVSCGGRRCVVTAMPRIMVEPFLSDFLRVDRVIGTELLIVNGFCTGLVTEPGVLVGGVKKRDALIRTVVHGGDVDPQQRLFDVGVGGQPSDHSFLSAVCNEAYIVDHARPPSAALPMEEYPKPLIFHDGRLVTRPTELTSLFIWIWLPAGITLAYLRMIAWITLPEPLALPMLALLGVKIRVKGAPPLPPPVVASGETESLSNRRREGTLFVCTHKTVMDGMMLSLAIRKKTAAAIYSVSSVVESMMPMKRVRLERERERDAELMRRVLREEGEDLMVCPEGTTCRERYLLRFSPLFAELSDRIVPVGMGVEGQSLFYGSTARGNKMLDPTYFFMNPSPCYAVNILDVLPGNQTCGAGGKAALQVANTVQKMLGSAMGYHCTQLTRKDKYRMLAGNDGKVRSKSSERTLT